MTEAPRGWYEAVVVGLPTVFSPAMPVNEVWVYEGGRIVQRLKFVDGRFEILREP